MSGKRPPNIVWATWDSLYGNLEVHKTREDAEREVARDRRYIRLIEYVMDVQSQGNSW